MSDFKKELRVTGSAGDTLDESAVCHRRLFTLTSTPSLQLASRSRREPLLTTEGNCSRVSGFHLVTRVLTTGEGKSLKCRSRKRAAYQLVSQRPPGGVLQLVFLPLRRLKLQLVPGTHTEDCGVSLLKEQRVLVSVPLSSVHAAALKRDMAM